MNSIAEELRLPPEVLVKQGITTYLERSLREVNAEILEITGKYGVSSIEEMDAAYRAGTISEAKSWRDFQRLDYLTAKREQLRRLLEELA